MFKIFSWTFCVSYMIYDIRYILIYIFSGEYVYSPWYLVYHVPAMYIIYIPVYIFSC